MKAEKRFELKRQIDRHRRQIDALMLTQYQISNQLDRHAKELESAEMELTLLDLPELDSVKMPTFIEFV